MAIAAQDALGKGLMEQYQRLSSMDQMEQMKELAKEFTDVVPVPLTVRYPPPPPFRQAGRVDNLPLSV